MPTPELIFDTLNAYQRTTALTAAIDLNLFTAVSEGNDTAASISARISTNERATRILCDYLSMIGFLKKEDGLYKLTPDSALFLDRRSPFYLGTTATFLSGLRHQHFFDNFADVIRKGGTLMGEGSVSPENPMWVEFARSMAPMMVLPAHAIAGILALEGPVKVLDIAAGHGLFGLAIAGQNPEAHITALDWPKVLDVARENAESRKLTAQYSTIEGNAFEADFGSGYDAVLLTNFLHHFDPATNEQLLRKVRASLKPGGRAAALEFVPDEGRTSPPIPAAFSMVMLATTQGGDAYTYRELETMFSNAGFKDCQQHSVPPGVQRLVVGTA